MHVVTPPPRKTSSESDTSLPTVSIVLPTLTEREFITDCLHSLFSQHYRNIVEVLVVDGGSKDGTREIVERFGDPIRLLDNPTGTTAAAMNIGIDAAKGNVIVRVDPNAVYDPDHVTKNVSALLDTGADHVAGSISPVGTASFSRAVAALAKMKGIGTVADTAYLGCWWTSTLRDLEGYDEESLQWAAEDDELNLRILKRGGKVIEEPEIGSASFLSSTPLGLARQYHNDGIGKASTLWKHKGLRTLRPLAPAMLVLATVGGFVVGRGPSRFLIPLTHSLFAGLVATKAARAPGVQLHRAAQAVSLMHWSHGAGFWRGLSWALRGRPFNNRSQGRG